MKEYKRIEDTESEDVKEPVIDYNKVYTYADYLKLEIDEMVEIIRGKILRMSPAPRIKHQGISINIASIIHSELREKIVKYTMLLSMLSCLLQTEKGPSLQRLSSRISV
ncbi:MAG: hypothetical protein IPL08_17940 [Saprospiraceae bacterium]|nr:hypothetical protein [Saprospiraceae bacterium]